MLAKKSVQSAVNPFQILRFVIKSVSTGLPHSSVPGVASGSVALPVLMRSQ